jgi:hypothetical protein
MIGGIIVGLSLFNLNLNFTYALIIGFWTFVVVSIFSIFLKIDFKKLIKDTIISIIVCYPIYVLTNNYFALFALIGLCYLGNFIEIYIGKGY